MRAGRGEKTGLVTTWEYLIVSLPEFEPAKAAQGASASVAVLNREGIDGWEAVGMTGLRDYSFAVLLKRPVPAAVPSNRPGPGQGRTT